MKTEPLFIRDTKLFNMKISMKTSIFVAIPLAVIMTVLLFGSTGCKTVVTTNTDGASITNKVVDSTAIISVINSVVPVGVQIAVAKSTNSIPYLKATAIAIDALVSAGVYSPSQLQTELVKLNVTNADAQMVIQAGLSIYKSFVADAVVAKLAEKDYLVVLKSLSDAINQGLMFASSTAGTSPAISVQIKQ